MFTFIVTTFDHVRSKWTNFEYHNFLLFIFSTILENNYDLIVYNMDYDSNPTTILILKTLIVRISEHDQACRIFKEI